MNRASGDNPQTCAGGNFNTGVAFDTRRLSKHTGCLILCIVLGLQTWPSKRHRTSSMSFQASVRLFFRNAKKCVYQIVNLYLEKWGPTLVYLCLGTNLKNVCQWLGKPRTIQNFCQVSGSPVTDKARLGLVSLVQLLPKSLCKNPGNKISYGFSSRSRCIYGHGRVLRSLNPKSSSPFR